MSVLEAEALSYLSIGLFIVTLILVVMGVTLRLKPRATHWLCVVSFSCVVLMGTLTSILYYWHHFLR